MKDKQYKWKRSYPTLQVYSFTLRSQLLRHDLDQWAFALCITIKKIGLGWDVYDAKGSVIHLKSRYKHTNLFLQEIFSNRVLECTPSLYLTSCVTTDKTVTSVRPSLKCRHIFIFTIFLPLVLRGDQASMIYCYRLFGIT